MSDESKYTPPGAEEFIDPTRKASEKGVDIDQPPTPEEWQQSVDSMTPEERELFDRLSRDSNTSETGKIVFISDKDGNETKTEEPASEEIPGLDYQSVISELNLNQEQIEELRGATIPELQEARTTGVREIRAIDLYLTHPSLMVMDDARFSSVKLPHEGIKILMEKVKTAKETRRRIELILSAINQVLSRSDVPNEPEIQEVQDDEKITFGDLKKRYSKYLEEDYKVSFGSKERVDSSDNHENYAANYLRAEEKGTGNTGVDRNIRQILSGEKVIDLGCGKIADNMAGYTIRHGAKAYIGVDKYHDNWAVNRDAARENSPTIAIMEDILTFMEQEPDESATVMLNGLDQFIFDMSDQNTKAYIELLAKEIARVAGSKHKIIGVESWPIFRELEKYGYSRHRLGYPSKVVSIEVHQKESAIRRSALFEKLIERD